MRSGASGGPSTGGVRCSTRRLGRWVIDGHRRGSPGSPQPRRGGGGDRVGHDGASSRCENVGIVDAQSAVLIVLGYLSGSVPVSVLVARWVGAADPRTVGSGRIGSMNSLRALGPSRAAVVFVGDLVKGFVPVSLASILGSGDAVEGAVAVAAVVGAWRSLFLGFSGGRGVVTAAGAMLPLAPAAVVLAAPVFVLVAVVVRYVSLASLLFTLVDTLLIVAWWAATPDVATPHAVAAVVTGAIVWVAHADNLQRLVAGTERRFDRALLRGGTGEGR